MVKDWKNNPFRRDKFCFFLARILLSSIFVFGAIGTVRDFSRTAADLAAKHFPAPLFVLGTAVSIELGGALSLLTGMKTRWGAYLLISFLIPVTLAYHNFWVQQGALRDAQLIHFLKNAAILGGLLFVAEARIVGRSA